MLVLSRKLNERVFIGGVCVEVVRMDCGKVRLGITAPAAVKVYREEVAPPEVRAAHPRPGCGSPAPGRRAG